MNTCAEPIELNTIYNEDCIIGMKTIKNETVDIIICDPPYNIGKDFGKQLQINFYFARFCLKN